MNMRNARWRAGLLSAVTALGLGWHQTAVAADSQVSAGTRFMVELRDKIEAKKAKRGKTFEARTLAARGGSVPESVILEQWACVELSGS